MLRDPPVGRDVARIFSGGGGRPGHLKAITRHAEGPRGEKVLEKESIFQK